MSSGGSMTQTERGCRLMILAATQHHHHAFRNHTPAVCQFLNFPGNNYRHNNFVRHFLTSTTCNQYISITSKMGSRTPDSALASTFPTQQKRSQMTVSVADMNPNLREMQYAVRGPIVIRAGELEEELAKGVEKPYKRIIRANIGDCHATGQKPITFLRQVLALLLDRSLFHNPDYPSDAKQRAERILQSCYGQSVGSYSDSVGIRAIREDVARFITQRDKVPSQPSDPDNILLTTGASEGIKLVMAFVNYSENKSRPAGIMIPVPQYPLYSATTAEYGIHKIDYFLDEDHNWSLDINELERSYEDALTKSTLRALVVLNPGNPTGGVLNRKNIEDIVKFAYERRLLIMADEVYQENVYAKNCQFISFRKVMLELGEPYNQLELVSFHSTSKGFLGECGLRGGYLEALNFAPDVLAQLKKCVSARLCSTTIGQAAIGVVVNPPQPNEPSYRQFQQEKSAVLASLARKARLVTDTLNAIEGYHCNEVQGAMYAFPRIDLPPGVLQKAKAQRVAPDFYYSMQLLEQCGICIVPGSGFGQRPNTYHFRTTILPSEEEISDMLSKVKQFHEKFIAAHGGYGSNDIDSEKEKRSSSSSGTR